MPLPLRLLVLGLCGAGLVLVLHAPGAVAQTPTPTPTPTPTDYDSDNDGLIAVATLAQLNAIRWDLDGDGAVDSGGDSTGYTAAFPNAAPGMGCPTSGDVIGCIGYELTTSLDFDTGTTGDRTDDTYYNGGQGWLAIAHRGGVPAGSGTFTAIFEGNGNTLSNLYISRTGGFGPSSGGTSTRVGLFGVISGATIRDVTLAAVTVSGNRTVGGLVAVSGGTISNSQVTSGTVTGNQQVGGLVGLNSTRGVISGSSAAVTVMAGTFALLSEVSPPPGLTTRQRFGGLAGENHAGTIRNSSATGNVTGAFELAGGLVGQNDNGGSIAASYATGNVTGMTGAETDAGRNIGGLVGRNDRESSIAASYATGAVTGTLNIGGLVGTNDRESTIRASYARTGTVTGTQQVGGLVGRNDRESSIAASYATGTVTGTLRRVGGLVGTSQRRSSIAASYATGAVNGGASGTRLGGLVGQNILEGTIRASYATGTVTGTPAGTADRDIGGLLGFNHTSSFRHGGITYGPSTVRDSYWDTTTSGVPVGIGSDDADHDGMIDGDETAQPGATGLTTAALRLPTATLLSTGYPDLYPDLYANWNRDLDNDGSADWDFGTICQYPALAVDFDGDDTASVAEFGTQRSTGAMCRPLGPQQVRVTPGTATTELTVTWAAPANDGESTITAYDVQHRTGTNAWTVVDDAWTSGALTYTISGLSAGTQYDVQVRAVNAIGDGAWSASWSGTTKIPIATMDLTLALTATTPDATRIRIARLEFGMGDSVTFAPTNDGETIELALAEVADPAAGTVAVAVTTTGATTVTLLGAGGQTRGTFAFGAADTDNTVTFRLPAGRTELTATLTFMEGTTARGTFTLRRPATPPPRPRPRPPSPPSGDGGSGSGGGSTSTSSTPSGPAPAPAPPATPLFSASTGAVTVTEQVDAPGQSSLVFQRHDRPAAPPVELGIGWISRDGTEQVVVGLVRDASLGQTYAIVRRESDGQIVRWWIAPDSPWVPHIPWPEVNTRYTVPLLVLAAVPLDERYPQPNQLVRRFDGGDGRIVAYDAGLGQWRHVPDEATFQALGFYWCDVTAADGAFFERITMGPPYPASNTPARSNYPSCRP